jgi:NAD(P)-dependent dehydrogenase (short-subunit alcohol dehydrogenase family)
MMHDKMVALVTGANKGLGKQIAKELVGHGYSVLLGSRNYANGVTAAQEIGDGAAAIQLDVTDATSIANAAQRIAEEYGRLDVLVNNAGISQSGRFASMQDIPPSSAVPLDEVRAVFETSVLAVTQAMLPMIRQAAAGRIVNVSSGMGSLTLNSDPAFPFRPYFGVTYGASKTAVNAITMALAIELEGTGIKVRAASPSYTATELNDFQGTDTVEVGARPLVLAALDAESPTASFTGADGAYPW